MKTKFEDDFPASSVQSADTIDRRRGTRIPFMDLCAVTFSSAEQPPQDTVVEDVSFAGVALRVTDVSQLAVGHTFEVAILRWRMEAIIKYITALPEGGFRIGAEFADRDSPQLKAALSEALSRS